MTQTDNIRKNTRHVVFDSAMLSELLGAQKLVVAYSGGLDSHVLLHLVSALQARLPSVIIQAVHVNHQLNQRSDEWAAHCQCVADQLKIPVFIEKIALELNPGDSLEEKARQARYFALKKYVDEHTLLLTAHNLNDQAETFLLQALRGAGPKGLSAMPVKKKFGKGWLVRPLLPFSRDDIQFYGVENQLQWVEDDSNLDPRFRRNFLRHQIFPLLKQHYPAVMESFSRSARLCAGHEKIIDEIIKLDFEQVKTDDVAKLNLKILREFASEKQRLLLREWFVQNQLRMPNEKHLKQIQRDVINTAPDSHPIFRLGQVELSLERKRGLLCISKRQAP